MITTFTNFFVTKRPFFTKACVFVNWCAGITSLVVIALAVVKHPFVRIFQRYGEQFGVISLLLFITVLIPGIARRYGIKHPLISLIMIYRRYIGILMFLMAMLHALTKRGVGMIQGIRYPFPPTADILWGFVALGIASVLFFTSNDKSITLLKRNWYTLHRLVYVMMFALLFHVALFDSNWMFIMALLVIAEIVGIIRSHLPKKVHAPVT